MRTFKSRNGIGPPVAKRARLNSPTPIPTATTAQIELQPGGVTVSADAAEAGAVILALRRRRSAGVADSTPYER
ncbi:hypothetical protein EF294_02125 [Gordonia oryzae]|uniref:Uncharacterized protein n=1 Tax=Gordonia oryzae TaxID=2487349 RepID=A0A3N4HFN8_9ACTN|nr:hypothetical protein [Gordonia oryzae]RPA65584.1 hypothetical protein EF294_02125 [Gordonia oryzae]